MGRGVQRRHMSGSRKEKKVMAEATDRTSRPGVVVVVVVVVVFGGGGWFEAV